MINGFLRWLYLMALIVWLGEVIFFSFVVAPAIFGAFPLEEAGRAVGALFPTYYRLGYACGTLLLATSIFLPPYAGSRVWRSVTPMLAALMLAATVYAGVVIQPRAAALRPQLHGATASQSLKDDFDRLHRQAVQLNGAVLLCGVVLSVITAATWRP